MLSEANEVALSGHGWHRWGDDYQLSTRQHFTYFVRRCVRFGRYEVRACGPFGNQDWSNSTPRGPEHPVPSPDRGRMTNLTKKGAK
jgi:hypothetical protein